jgi:hypothetical protein
MKESQTKRNWYFLFRAAAQVGKGELRWPEEAE